MPLEMTKHATDRLKSRFGLAVDREQGAAIATWMLSQSTRVEDAGDGCARYTKPGVWVVVVCQNGTVRTICKDYYFREDVAKKWLKRLRREVLG